MVVWAAQAVDWSCLCRTRPQTSDSAPEDFLLVSVLESNGSSQAKCTSTRALMDAGVPPRPVATAAGLVMEGGSTDIHEDHQAIWTTSRDSCQPGNGYQDSSDYWKLS